MLEVRDLFLPELLLLRLIIPLEEGGRFTGLNVTVLQTHVVKAESREQNSLGVLVDGDF